MRARVVLVIAAVALSGCVKDEAPTQTNAIVPGTLSGVVTDVGLRPLADANVSVEGMNVSAITDAAGSFSIPILPGEYVVLASHADHKTGALRASVLSDKTSALAFQLDAIPRIVPRVDVAQAEGYLACTALLVASSEQRPLACGESDPNERPAVEFTLGSTNGLEAVVVELVWESKTDAARWLRVDLELDGEQPVALGGSEGASPIVVALPGRLLTPGVLVVRASPAGSFTDEEAGADAGVALQQSFTAYASSFYWAPPSPGYSAQQT